MKTIKNEKILIHNEEKNYCDLIDICVKVTPKEGFDYNLMESISRIDAALKGQKSKKTVDLEDSDFEFVKSKVLAMQWGVYDEGLFSFVKYIKSI
jgi:hypothetical protein